MAESDSKTEAGVAQPQPGQVVAPGGAAPVQPATVAQSHPAPQKAPDEASMRPAANAADLLGSDRAAMSGGADDTVSWTASEFVAHEKSSSWYLGLAAIGVVVAGLVFLVTRDIISTIVVVVGAGAFGILGSRKPRQQEYNLDPSGVSIGQKHYNFSLFRSFSVVPEGAFSSIVFMPLKRFAQTTTIYYAPEDEDKIVDLISLSLPFEERKADAVDSLMRRIRF